MISAPWYLLSAGAVVLIIGAILHVVRRPSQADLYIDPKMDDEEIVERLERLKGDPLTKIVLGLGLLLVLVSLVWRLLRVFI